jgi:hypothetical protein
MRRNLVTLGLEFLNRFNRENNNFSWLKEKDRRLLPCSCELILLFLVKQWIASEERIAMWNTNLFYRAGQVVESL